MSVFFPDTMRNSRGSFWQVGVHRAVHEGGPACRHSAASCAAAAAEALLLGWRRRRSFRTRRSSLRCVQGNVIGYGAELGEHTVKFEDGECVVRVQGRGLRQAVW